MGVSVPIVAIVVSFYLVAFLLAVGAERRRSTAAVVPDEYDEKTYCSYATDASTVYGLSAFVLLAVAQALLNGVTKCFCLGRGLMGGRSAKTLAIVFFAFSWASFVAAEACLLAGSARNAYHTKYRANFGIEHLSCATLRKGVFAAGAAITLLAMTTSVIYYWAHSMADTDGWVKHQNEGGGLNLTTKNQNPPPGGEA